MAEKQMSYPEGSVPSSLHWLHVGRRVTSELADSWFESFNPKSVRDSLFKEWTAYDDLAKIALDTSLVVGNEYKIISEFSASMTNIGYEYVPILQSELGKSILKTLDDNEMVYYFENNLLIDDFQFVEVDDEFALRVHLPWETYFGSRFMQSFVIYRNAEGNEECYWHSPVLYGSRPMLGRNYYEILTDIEDPDSIVEINLSKEERERGVLAFDDWSREIYLPWLAKSLFYLAETPFPSSIMNMSRSLAFSGLNEAQFPIPHMQIENRAQLLAVGTRSNGERVTYPALNILAPQQMQMGWLFSTQDSKSQLQILSRITDGLVRVNSYLQDGYLNHNEPESPFCFDGVVFSGNQLERKFADTGMQGGYYRWIPTPEVFDLLEQTEELWASIDEPDKTQEQKNSLYAWIGDEGIGNAAVASCLNDGMYSIFIPNEYWGAFDFYAPTAFRLDVKDQSTNAMSNWGVAHYIQGNFEMAIKCFEIALDREDKFAEDEASFYLSKIYEKQGDLAKSEEYRKRCEAAGGYEPTYI